MAPRPTKKAAPAKKATEAPPAPAAKVTKKSDINDPPKRAINAYMIFVRENRDAIRAGSKINNFNKAAAAAWKKLEDKSEWEKMAKDDKERYQREMAEYGGGQGQ